MLFAGKWMELENIILNKVGGGGEEPLPIRSCLLPLGGVPLPSPNWIFRGGAQGSVCLLEVWEEGLYPIPLSRHMEVVGRGLPLSRKAESLGSSLFPGTYPTVYSHSTLQMKRLNQCPDHKGPAVYHPHSASFLGTLGEGSREGACIHWTPGHLDTRLLLPLHTMIKQNLSSCLRIRVKILIATLQKDNLGERT
jgi:hypothetical protein